MLYLCHKYKDNNRLCYKFIHFLCAIFPLLDTKINVGDGWLVGAYLTAVFIIFNSRILKGINLKSFSLIYMLIVSYFLSALFSEFPVDSLLSIYKYLTGFIIFFISIRAVRYKGLSYMSDMVMRYVTFWTLLFFCIQLFDKDFSLLTFFQEVAVGRLVSCYQDSQVSGLVTAILATYYFNKYLAEGKNKFGLLVLVLTVFIGLTGSKSGLLGEGAGLVVSLFFHKAPIKLIVLTPVFMLGLILTQPLWSELATVQRMQDLDKSKDTRMFYWAHAVSIYEKNPVVGVGPGCFKRYITEHKIPMKHFHGGDNIYADQPESGYLMWLDESGTIGAVAYLLLLVYLFVLRGKGNYNISLIMPFLVSCVGLYTLRYFSVVLVLFSLISYMYIVKGKSRQYLN